MDKDTDLSSLIKSLIQHFGSPKSAAKHLSALPQMAESTDKPSSSQTSVEVPGETFAPAPSPKGSPKRSTTESSVGTDVASVSLQMVETPINPEPISTVTPFEIFHSKMASCPGSSLKVDEELKKGQSPLHNPTVHAVSEKSTGHPAFGADQHQTPFVTPSEESIPSSKEESAHASQDISLERIGEIAKEALLDLASQPGSDVDKALVVAEEECTGVGNEPTSMDVDKTEKALDVDQDVDPEESTYVIDVETFVPDKKSRKRKAGMASLRRSSRSKSTRVIPSTLNLPSREDSDVGPTSQPPVLKPKVEHSPTSKSGKVSSASHTTSPRISCSGSSSESEVEVSKSHSTRFYTREAKNALKVLAARKFHNDRRANEDFFSKYKLDILLQDRGMWGTVVNVFAYDAQIVMEFYVNLMTEAFDPKSVKYGKVFVRGKVFNFSLFAINKACYTANPNTDDVEVDDDEMTRELTGGKLKAWTSKFAASTLSWKYSVLHKIAVYNWLPSKNTTALTKEQVEFIFKVGKPLAFNFGEQVFVNISRAAFKSTGGSMLLFPSLIYNLLVQQGLKEREEAVLVEEKNLLEFYKTLLTPDRVKDLPYESPRAGPSLSPQPDDEADSAEAEIDKYGDDEYVDRATAPNVALDVSNISSIKAHLTKETSTSRKGKEPAGDSEVEIDLDVAELIKAREDLLKLKRQVQLMVDRTIKMGQDMLARVDCCEQVFSKLLPFPSSTKKGE
ncbi:uncharacterized protein LOC131015849 [Salvia miltiorrhiza]|uniref:uncharacterized protein LOC131015849 n=1 Tax=Salvia miltiorrhiza TaxID=226208 RepID=UPI0025AC7078|nr:uncharacterized protein LOC131015849 [Salvia miltiorrhiza]